MTTVPHVFYEFGSTGHIRQDLTSNLVGKLITQGQCLSVSAPNNFGKSYFLRQLLTTSALASHTNLLIIHLDCNLRADDSPQAFYELVLKELVTTFNNQELAVLYRELVTVTGSARSSFEVSHAFLTAFELVKELLPASGKRRLVLVLDEFDQVMLKFPEVVFRHLRAIKDRYGDKLVYVVGTNRPLLALGREEEEDLAEFYELFEIGNLIRLRGLTRIETNKLVSSHLAGPGLTKEKLGWIYEIAGGHPGLTIRLIQLLEVETATSIEEFTVLARLDPQLRLECRRIWNSLDPSERIALLQWLEGIRNLVIDPILGSLEERGLLQSISPASKASNSQSPAGSQQVFARAFEWFLLDKLQFEKAQTVPTPNMRSSVSSFKRNGDGGGDKDSERDGDGDGMFNSVQPLQTSSTSSSSKLSFDPVHEVVIFEGGKSQLPLTGNSALLFKYLYLRQSIPYCSKDELISAVWGQEAAYSSENLDRLVSDLRQLLGDHDKQFIRTIHRRGLQMVGVAEWRLHSPL